MRNYKGLIETPSWVFSITFYFKIFFFAILIVLFLPWQQFTVGKGRITTLDPKDRLQEIHAPITGIIKKWSVIEGQLVSKGDTIVELMDNDPEILMRLEADRVASEEMLKSAELAYQTSKINQKRQENLFDKGLTSRKDYEAAQIRVSQLKIEVSKAQAQLLKSERELARQKTQLVVAPKDGYVVRILPGEGGQILKAGDVLVVFAPIAEQLAAEVWIDPNDIPLLRVGNTARIQFAGWPAVQTAGYPSLAINTFGGEIHLVDTASSKDGMFRVLLKPTEPWPSELYLKQGTLLSANIHFGTVLLIWEIWRLVNGVAPNRYPIQDELEKLFLMKTQ